MEKHPPLGRAAEPRPQCPPVSSSVTQCPPVSSSITQCHPESPRVTQCHLVSPSVLQSHPVSPSVPQCPPVSPSVPQCHQGAVLALGVPLGTHFPPPGLLCLADSSHFAISEPNSLFPLPLGIISPPVPCTSSSFVCPFPTFLSLESLSGTRSHEVKPDLPAASSAFGLLLHFHI